MSTARQPDGLFDRIATRLLRGNNPVSDDSSRTRAAVAMILNRTDNDMEVLFIQRALHKDDPWSGHIAFPGGKLEEGEQVCETAQRETLEEVGLDLQDACYLGQLPDITGANLPVRVSCCLFGIDRTTVNPTLNEEVSDLFWVKFSDLRDRKHHLQAVVSFGDKKMEVPAIRLPGKYRPVLWGITYRLLMEFLELLESNDSEIVLREPVPYEISI